MSGADVVPRFYGAVEGGDLAGGLALLAFDCALTEMDSLAAGRTYRPGGNGGIHRRAHSGAESGKESR